MTADELDNDDRPWERPGARRRDCEPHQPLRPTLMRFLVTLFAGCIASSLYLLGASTTSGPLVPAAGSVIAGVLGLPLSAMTWAMARADMEKMRVNLMDPKGRVSTANALRYARIGTVFCAVLSVANAAVTVWKLLT
jgi:hypothetical protein